VEIELGPEARYALDTLNPDLVRVWDRNNTYLFHDSFLVTLCVKNQPPQRRDVSMETSK